MHHRIGHMVGYPLLSRQQTWRPTPSPSDIWRPVQTWGLTRHLVVATKAGGTHYSVMLWCCQLLPPQKKERTTMLNVIIKNFLFICHEVCVPTCFGNFTSSSLISHSFFAASSSSAWLHSFTSRQSLEEFRKKTAVTLQLHRTVGTCRNGQFTLSISWTITIVITCRDGSGILSRVGRQPCTEGDPPTPIAIFFSIEVSECLNWVQYLFSGLELLILFIPKYRNRSRDLKLSWFNLSQG